MGITLASFHELGHTPFCKDRLKKLHKKGAKAAAHVFRTKVGNSSGTLAAPSLILPKLQRTSFSETVSSERKPPGRGGRRMSEEEGQCCEKLRRKLALNALAIFVESDVLTPSTIKLVEEVKPRHERTNFHNFLGLPPMFQM